MITRPRAMSTTITPPAADTLSRLELLFVASALLAPLNLHVMKALTLYDAVTAIIALVVLVGPGRMRASPSSLRIAAALLLVAGLVGVFRSTYPIESGLQVVQYAFVFFVQIPVILTLGRSRPAVHGALLTLITGYLLVMIVAFVSQRVQLAGRVVPFFNENPNALAIPTIIFVPFVLFFVLDRWRIGQRFAVLVAGGSVLYLMLWSLAASASRGSTISTVVSLTVFVALRDGWDRTARVAMRAATMLVALVAIGVLIHSTSLFPDTLRSRIEGTLNPSDENQVVADERVALDRSGVRAFLASPLVGTGFDNFRYVAQFYDDEATFHEPHNLWIQFLAQTGIVGTGAFLFIIVRWYVLLARAQRRATDRSDRQLLWAFIAAMTGLMVHAMVAPLILQRQYWLLYGLGVATAVGVSRHAGPHRARHDGQPELTSDGAGA